MAVTANQAIAIWTITGHTLYARTWDNGETFWLCQQVTGTPGGAEDTFVVREPHLLFGPQDLQWLSGYNATTGAALAPEFEKHVYPGETASTTTRTVHGLGKGYPVNFTIPAGYAKSTNGEPEVVKANTNAKKETGASNKTDANGNPVAKTFFQKFKYWIIGGAVAVVGVVVYVVTRKKGKKRQ